MQYRNHLHVELGNLLFSYLHLAIAMVMELFLHKEPYTISKTAAGAMNDLGQTQVVGPMRSLDERRALLGVFCTTSM